MKYYKYLDLDYKPVTEKLRIYIANNMPDLLDPGQYSRSWRFTNTQLLKEQVPELQQLFDPLNITVQWLAFFVTVHRYGSIHIDNDRHEARINLPILNCEDSETRFFTTTDKHMSKVPQGGGQSFIRVNPLLTQHVDQFYLDRGAVIMRNTEPHQVVSTNPNQPRISCTIAFEENIEHLLE